MYVVTNERNENSQISLITDGDDAAQRGNNNKKKNGSRKVKSICLFLTGSYRRGARDCYGAVWRDHSLSISI